MFKYLRIELWKYPCVTLWVIRGFRFPQTIFWTTVDFGSCISCCALGRGYLSGLPVWKTRKGTPMSWWKHPVNYFTVVLVCRVWLTPLRSVVKLLPVTVGCSLWGHTTPGKTSPALNQWKALLHMFEPCQCPPYLSAQCLFFCNSATLLTSAGLVIRYNPWCFCDGWRLVSSLGETFKIIESNC